MKLYVVLTGALALLWAVLSGFDAPHAGYGAAAIAISVAWSSRLYTREDGKRTLADEFGEMRLWYFVLVVVPRVSWEALLGTRTMIWKILLWKIWPHKAAIESTVVSFAYRLENSIARVILKNIISLIPTTVSAEDDGTWIKVLALHPEDADGIFDQKGLANMVCTLFGEKPMSEQDFAREDTPQGLEDDEVHPTFDLALGASGIGTTAPVTMMMVGLAYQQISLFVDIATLWTLYNFVSGIVGAKYLEKKGAGTRADNHLRKSLYLVSTLFYGVGVVVYYQKVGQLPLFSAVAIGIGMIIFGIGKLGLFRLPTFFCRVHAVAKLDTVGLFCICVGMVAAELVDGSVKNAAKMLVPSGLIIIANPASSHAIVRAALRWIQIEKVQLFSALTIIGDPKSNHTLVHAMLRWAEKQGYTSPTRMNDSLLGALRPFVIDAGLEMRNMFAVGFVLSSFSFIISTFYGVMGAGDVAITEAAVTTLAGIGWNMVVYHTSDQDDAGVRPWDIVRILGEIAIFAFCSAVVIANIHLPAFGDPNSPASIHVGAWFMEWCPLGSHSPNAVGCIVGDGRPFDTFGETEVIVGAAAVAIFIFSILGVAIWKLTDEGMLEKMDSDIVVLTALIVSPIAIVIGFYVFTFGHYSFGGGFPAGGILASNVQLQRVVLGYAHSARKLSTKQAFAMALTGILIMGGLAVSSIYYEGQLLEYGVIPFLGGDPETRRGYGILVFEFGVMLSVAGSFTVLLDLLAAAVAGKERRA